LAQQESRRHMRKKWGARMKDAARQVVDPIVKAFTPAPKRCRDPWLDATAHQREVNRAAARRPHPHQALLDAIDEVHRDGGPRWIPKRPGWLR
jgi:hypothetical protein